MLQIFIRPRKKDLVPQVQFYPREVKQDGNWNQLAGPENSASPLTIRQAAYLFDAHFTKETNVMLPQIEGFEPWLYVMAGSLEVAGQKLTKGQAVTGTKEELAQLKVEPETSLVLLMADLTADMTYAGKFSEIKRFEYVTKK